MLHFPFDCKGLPTSVMQHGAQMPKPSVFALLSLLIVVLEALTWAQFGPPCTPYDCQRLTPSNQAFGIEAATRATAPHGLSKCFSWSTGVQPYCRQYMIHASQLWLHLIFQIRVACLPLFSSVSQAQCSVPVNLNPLWTTFAPPPSSPMTHPLA